LRMNPAWFDICLWMVSHRWNFIANLCVILQKQAWIRCSATATRHTLKISWDLNAHMRSPWMIMPVAQSSSTKRAGTLSQLTLRLTAQAAMSTTNWIIEKCVHSGCQVPQVTIPMTGNENHTQTHLTRSPNTTTSWCSALLRGLIIRHPKKIQHQWRGRINLLPYQRNTWQCYSVRKTTDVWLLGISLNAVSPSWWALVWYTRHVMTRLSSQNALALCQNINIFHYNASPKMLPTGIVTAFRHPTHRHHSRISLPVISISIFME
jgi:hypothetical protein